MWRFWQTSTVVPLSENLRHLLATERGVNEERAGSLRVVKERGHYFGRRVTYFQVFDPSIAQPPGGGSRHFADRDPQILYSGHLESDGQVVLNM